MDFASVLYNQDPGWAHHSVPGLLADLVSRQMRETSWWVLQSRLSDVRRCFYTVQIACQPKTSDLCYCLQTSTGRRMKGLA